MKISGPKIQYEETGGQKLTKASLIYRTKTKIKTEKVKRHETENKTQCVPKKW